MTTMDSLKPNTPSTKSKFSKTFHKITSLKKTKSKTNNNNNPFCLLIPNDKKPNCFPKTHMEVDENEPESETKSLKNRASLEALIATLFATISSVKAGYAELQLAQFPYNSDLVQAVDESLVRELKTLSELKHNFLWKKFDHSPPHVTFMLAEIQEQQSLMKMYEITMKKMQNEAKAKENDVFLLKEKLEEIVSGNKLVEKTINSSGQFSILDCIRLSGEGKGKASPGDFSVVLNYTVRSIRSFVKLMVKEMEGSGWDIEAAAKSIQSGISFPKANHRCFAFESFVCKEMFDGFEDIHFGFTKENVLKGSTFVEQFETLKSVNPVHFLKMFPDSGFAGFTRGKYLRLIHPKMETSFSGNLNQRKVINSGGVPDTLFFASFAEVSKRIWLLHCLAFSYGEEVGIFQVEKGSRQSDVYMESATDDVFAKVAEDGGFRVAFTVVPGFKIGKTVVQSQVYLFPAKTSRR